MYMVLIPTQLFSHFRGYKLVLYRAPSEGSSNGSERRGAHRGVMAKVKRRTAHVHFGLEAGSGITFLCEIQRHGSKWVHCCVGGGGQQN